MRTQAPWLPYDPTWLVELAKAQHPRRKWLQRAFAECTLARTNTCCASKVCGYSFVDSTNANEPGSAWQYKTTLFLNEHPKCPFIVVRILEGNEVGSITFD